MDSLRRIGGIAAGFLSFTVQAISADLASVPAGSKSAPGQCHGYFGRPITEDMLSGMHDAGCCDVLLDMEQSAAVNALERRLHCEGWHHYVAQYGVPPMSLEDLASGDPMPPANVPPVTIPASVLTRATPPAVTISVRPPVVATPAVAAPDRFGTDGVSLPPRPPTTVQAPPAVVGPRPELIPQ